VSAPWSVIGVPIDSVGRAGGTEHAPAAVREHDLLARLGAEDRGDLDVRIHGEERDPATGVIGIADTLAATEAVRAAVRDVVADGRRALVLGGCCALVPGALAGLRDAVGALGVAYVDGHVDVYDGTTSPSGEGADMPMSVAFGRGPDAWVDAAGGASVAPADVVVLGARDPEEAADIADLRAGRSLRSRSSVPTSSARRGCVPRAPAPRSGWVLTGGPSGSTSTSTCSTSARCRRPTTSCPTASSGTS
jgi:arginase